MSTLVTLFVFFHMVCWAAAFGIWVAAIRTKQPNKAIVHAAVAAPVFGLIAALVAIVGIDPNYVDHVSIGIKAVLAIAVAICAVVANKKQENTPAAIWYAIPVGILASMLVALF